MMPRKYSALNWKFNISKSNTSVRPSFLCSAQILADGLAASADFANGQFFAELIADLPEFAGELETFGEIQVVFDLLERTRMGLPRWEGV